MGAFKNNGNVLYRESRFVSVYIYHNLLIICYKHKPGIQNLKKNENWCYYILFIILN